MAPIIQSESYTLVVVGRHNPSIHHPSWYLQNDLITEDESKIALADGDLSCLPVIAQFRTSTFTVTCDQERWIIAVQSATHLERLSELVNTTFSILDETPVRAFGFNTEQHAMIDGGEVAAKINRQMQLANFGLPAMGDDVKSKMHVVYPKEHGHTAIKFEASARDASALYLSVNHHYDCPNDNTDFHKFDLGAMTTRAIPECMASSKSTLASLVKHIK